jgi:TatA/E family protein of Tat protein translocase
MEPHDMFLREPSHILILLLVVVILFGAKRLPDSARSLGRSLRIFKSEVKELNKDEEKKPDSNS